MCVWTSIELALNQKGSKGVLQAATLENKFIVLGAVVLALGEMHGHRFWNGFGMYSMSNKVMESFQKTFKIGP